VPTVLLVRHGRTDANASGTLAGHTPGIRLDRTGRAQAAALAERLAPVPLTAIVSSPLERCVETAEAVAADRSGLAVANDDRLVECRYGEWTGRPLAELSRTALWKRVQTHPSAVAFPGGESMRAMQARAVEAVREHNVRVAEQAGDSALWVAVSHGDVIKAIVADALGLHLDLFQRIVIDPGSVSVVSYTDLRPFVVRLNDTGGDLSQLRLRRRRRRRSSDAVVGGGAGNE
jgi:probable phosphomutase (TIGR03848 family)